jgi:hypothetical protein
MSWNMLARRLRAPFSRRRRSPFRRPPGKASRWRFRPRREGLEDRVVSVHEFFELDGDAITNRGTHDWDQVYDDFLNNTNTSGAIASDFFTDLSCGPEQP